MPKYKIEVVSLIAHGQKVSKVFDTNNGQEITVPLHTLKPFTKFNRSIRQNAVRCAVIEYMMCHKMIGSAFSYHIEGEFEVYTVNDKPDEDCILLGVVTIGPRISERMGSW